MKIWDHVNGTCLKQIDGHAGEVYSLLEISDDRLAVASKEFITVWDCATGKCIQKLAEGGRCKRLSCNTFFSYRPYQDQLTIWTIHPTTKARKKQRERDRFGCKSFFRK